MNSIAHSAAFQRRTHFRGSVRVPARVTAGGSRALDALTVDLSIDRVSLVSTQQLKLGEECLVEIGIGRSGLVRPLAAKATVLYCIAAGSVRGLALFHSGFRFTGLSSEAQQMIAATLA